MAANSSTTRGRYPRRTAIPFIFASATLIVVTLLLGAKVYCAYYNTLDHNGRWAAAKLLLPYGHVVGARPFFYQNQALAGGALNLGAWHGFQEVALQIPQPLEYLRFRFKLDAASYLYVLFREEDGDAAGVRISCLDSTPSSAVYADREGQFRAQTPLPIQELDSEKWYECIVQRAETGLAISIDGQKPVQAAFAPRGVARLAFRGGLHNVKIDDVLFQSDNASAPFFEDFANRRDWPAGLIATSIALVLIHAAYMLFLVWMGADRRTIESSLLILNATVAIFAGIVYFGFTDTLASRYPTIRREPPDFVSRRTREAVERVAQSVEAAPEKTRILFLGSSQTWGEGVENADQTFSERVERALRQRGLDTVCLNAGIQSARANLIVDVFKREWQQLHASVVVVNLGNNDQDNPAFAEHLSGLLRAIQDSGSRPLLIVEANSPEFTPGLPTYPVMHRIASAMGVPIIDMNAHLAERNATGMLWWDHVHLTPYGHHLVASRIVQEMEALGLAPPLLQSTRLYCPWLY